MDGGAAANNLLMQLQSDYLGSKIYRPRMIETTAAGAGYLAGLGVGFWANLEEIKKIWKVDREFVPELKPAARKIRLQHWHQAVAQTMYHP